MLREARERIRRLRERRRQESARLSSQMVPNASIMGLVSMGKGDGEDIDILGYKGKLL